MREGAAPLLPLLPLLPFPETFAMTITDARPASSPPSAEAIELAVEGASLSDIMLCATASLDAVVVDWNCFSSVRAAVETDTYRTAGRLASMVFGLAFQPAAGMPTLATVLVTAGLLNESVVLLSIDCTTPVPEADAVPSAQTTGLPEWPTPVATLLARALHQVMQIAQAPETAGAGDPLDEIREIALKAILFDHDRMRLRIDDHHGNRSFVRFVDGQWKAFAVDGRQVRFSYCFGSHGPEDEIVRDLAEATTIHEIQRAAMRHVRGLQNVQVEKVFERHTWDGERFSHMPLGAGSR